MDTIKNCETIVTKLIINEQQIYIQTVWEENDSYLFSVQIFDDNKSWLGNYTTEMANKFMQRFKQTKEEYVMDVKSCLTKINPMYKYDFIISKENKGTFLWKKKFEGSAVVLQGSVEVQLSMSSSNGNILIDSLIQENQNLRNNLEICKKEIKQSDCDLRKCKDELEKLNNINSSLEDILLSKFVQLLNTKKRRIQVLEDALNNIDDS